MSDRSVTRLGVLDGLRGLAILMVVWYHLWLVSGYTIPLLGFAQVLVQNGFLGVDLFFFLSGFCIALPYARARRDGTPVPHASDFARKRALKILPSYLLALGVFAIAFRDRFDGPLQELGHFAAHAAFVHVFSPVTFGSFSGPLWTLAVEVQFYVLFALIAPFVVKRPFLVYAMLVAAAVLYRTAIAALGFDGDFGWVNQLPAVLDVFGGGVAAAFAYTMLGARQRSPLLGTAAAAIGSMPPTVAMKPCIAGSTRGGSHSDPCCSSRRSGSRSARRASTVLRALARCADSPRSRTARTSVTSRSSWRSRAPVFRPRRFFGSARSSRSWFRRW
jgi:peptidoglycan/LPS O-acetylase OafA/YrhL